MKPVIVFAVLNGFIGVRATNSSEAVPSEHPRQVSDPSVPQMSTKPVGGDNSSEAPPVDSSRREDQDTDHSSLLQAVPRPKVQSTQQPTQPVRKTLCPRGSFLHVGPLRADYACERPVGTSDTRSQETFPATSHHVAHGPNSETARRREEMHERMHEHRQGEGDELRRPPTMLNLTRERCQASCVEYLALRAHNPYYDISVVGCCKLDREADECYFVPDGWLRQNFVQTNICQDGICFPVRTHIREENEDADAASLSACLDFNGANVAPIEVEHEGRPL